MPLPHETFRPDLMQYNTSEMIDMRLKELGYSEFDIKNRRCAVCAPGNTMSKSQFEREVTCLINGVDHKITMTLAAHSISERGERVAAQSMGTIKSLLQVQVMDDDKYNEIRKEAQDLETHRLLLALKLLADKLDTVTGAKEMLRHSS